MHRCQEAGIAGIRLNFKNSKLKLHRDADALIPFPALVIACLLIAFPRSVMMSVPSQPPVVAARSFSINGKNRLGRHAVSAT